MSIIAAINWPFRWLFLKLIRLYQWTLSPIMGRQCRFHPTCSKYGYEAIEVYGPWRGGWMALRRICRCNPFHKGGYDPVPPRDGEGAEEKKAGAAEVGPPGSGQ